MTTTKRQSFTKWLAEQRKNPEFREQFDAARKEIQKENLELAALREKYQALKYWRLKYQELLARFNHLCDRERRASNALARLAGIDTKFASAQAMAEFAKTVLKELQ